MSDGSRTRDGATGAHEWMTLSDDLLAGLIHALNNRVTAMTACAELLALGDRQMAADGLLATEVTQLQRTGALISLLPARAAGAEAVELVHVLDDAVSLHAHHPHLRAIACVVERAGVPQPVRAQRWALLRLLLLVVQAAKTAAAEQRQDHATLHLHGDDARVTLRADTAGRGAGAYADEMAARCGAVLERDGTELALTLPSLAEVRRRERGARSSG